MNKCNKCGKSLDASAKQIKDQWGNWQSICGDCARKVSLYGRL